LKSLTLIIISLTLAMILFLATIILVGSISKTEKTGQLYLDYQQYDITVLIDYELQAVCYLRGENGVSCLPIGQIEVRSVDRMMFGNPILIQDIPDTHTDQYLRDNVVPEIKK